MASKGTIDQPNRLLRVLLTRAAVVGSAAGAFVAGWDLAGMYTAIPIWVWDVGRQILFLAAVVAATAAALGPFRYHKGWTLAGLCAFVASLCCAVIVLAAYSVSTRYGTEQIRQVPEFIRDYTNNGYRSPAAYFGTNFWDLLELQIYMWAISVVGMTIVGTILGRTVYRRAFRKDVPHLRRWESNESIDKSTK